MWTLKPTAVVPAAQEYGPNGEPPVPPIAAVTVPAGTFITTAADWALVAKPTCCFTLTLTGPGARPAGTVTVTPRPSVGLVEQSAATSNTFAPCVNTTVAPMVSVP